MAGFPDHGVVAEVQRPAAVRRTAVRPQARAKRIGAYAILIVLAVITIFPLLWMVLTSLTPQNEVFGALLPTTIDPSGYGRIWTSGNLPRALANSVIVTGMTVVIVVGVATLTGYAFARLTFPARDWIFYVFLAAMMIPGQAILVPMFIFLKQIGLLDTLPGLSFSHLGGALPLCDVPDAGVLQDVAH